MAGTATTLEGRLLCASGCAYAAIEGDSTIDADTSKPYFPGVGYANPPSAFVAGTEDIDACVVGTTSDGVVVSFRGTLPPHGPFTMAKLIDWVNDFHAAPSAGVGLPGDVHEGFLGSLNSLWDAVRDETKRQLTSAGPGTPLLITGHSKGGAIAALAAMRFRSQEGLASKVITYAAPKPGDAVFANAYNAVMDHTRYEYAEDIVPHLPPSGAFLEVLGRFSFFQRHLSDIEDFDYERVGTLKYIDASGVLTTITSDQSADALLQVRRERIWRLALTSQIGEIANDHSIACPSGYMTQICPTGVCSTQPRASA